MLWYGIAGFALIMLVSFWRRTDRYEDLCVATFILVFLLLLTALGTFEGFLRPLTWDARLRAADLYLGLDGFALARLCWETTWLRILATISYCALPFAFALNWSLERSRLALRAAVIGGFLAFPLYLLVPACGPQYAFAGYPWHPVVLPGLTVVSTLYARNCFPSMHFSWALLLALNARNKLWRGTLFGYSILVGLSAVGGGEHYFIDLIAAVPFTWGVQWVAEQSFGWQKRWQSSRLAAERRPPSFGRRFPEGIQCHQLMEGRKADVHEG